jgi:hypothetical protein
MTTIIEERVDALKQMFAEIELGVLTEGYTLADAIREGSQVSDQKIGGWGDGKNACALTAAYMAAKARDLV